MCVSEQVLEACECERTRALQTSYILNYDFIIIISIHQTELCYTRFFFKIELVFISIFTSSRDDTMAILKIKKKRGGPSSYRGANHALHF